MNREPSNEPRVIDLLALERVSSEFETRESLREESSKRQQKAMKRRTTTAWKLLDIVHKLEEEAGESRILGRRFEPGSFADPLVDSFFAVCVIMAESEMGSMLETLDEAKMITFYGKEREPELAKLGYRTAIQALSEGIAHGNQPPFAAQLRATVQNIAGRHTWYMMYPIVRGLLVGDRRIFRLTDKQTEDEASRQDSQEQAMPEKEVIDETAVEAGSQHLEQPIETLPNGPFGADGFRYAGLEVRFGRAAKQRSLVLGLWDAESGRPREAREIEDVLAEVYGESNDTSDPTFRQLCADTRGKLRSAGVPLNIETLQGKVCLTPHEL